MTLPMAAWPVYPAGGVLNPLEHLTDVKIFIDPSADYRTLRDSYVSALVNRGDLADIEQIVEAAQSGWNSEDANFNGKSSMSFDGIDDFFPLPDLSALTEFEIFVIAKHDLNVPLTTNKAGSWWTGSHTGTQWIRHTNENVYIHDGSTTRTSGIAMDKDLSNPYIYNEVSTASEKTFRFNGTEYYTTATNIVGCRSDPMLGKSWWNAFLLGDVASFIVCGAEQTPTARAWMEGPYAASLGVTL